MNLADALVSQSYQDKDVIVKQGAAADGMYFIEQGQVLIVVKGEDGTEREVVTVTPACCKHSKSYRLFHSHR